MALKRTVKGSSIVMKRAAKRPAVKGWLFVKGDMQYYVGAPDSETARRYLAAHDKKAAESEPTRVSQAVVNFLKLNLGTVVSSRVIERRRM